MKAIRVRATGGPEVLQIETIPTPSPRPGELLIRVEAAGVNFIDLYQRSGAYPMPTPFTPGQEAGGTVAAVGTGVSGFAVGDRVACYAGGLSAYAEYAIAPADKVVSLPAGVTTAQGTAVLLQGMTAHYLACTTYPLHPGDTCLVHAAAGGVGLLLCQLAKRRGARVIGTVSTAEKEALARGAGADEIIRYTEVDFAPEVKRLTGGTGVQVVYDSVGKTTFTAGLGCLVPRGLMVLYGQSSGAVEPLEPQILNQRGSLFLTRPTLAHYVAARAELEQRSGDLFRWIQEGTLHVRIDRELPLARAPEAHAALASRTTTGKVLLLP
ncbi:MAG TPA: quinone oxidoreductase [Gemmatimonadales bacterium]|nr:quinone oxidoreductase [Gemmatimonadales bacterium]